MILICLGFATISVAQGISKELCSEAQRYIQQSSTRVRITRNKVYSDECDFAIRINENDRASVSLTKFESIPLAANGLRSDLELFTARDLLDDSAKYRVIEVNVDHFWDQSVAHQYEYADHFILLRKYQYCITLLSTDFEAALDIQKNLRRLNFVKP